MPKKNHIVPVPETFAGYDEAADFRTIKAVSELRGRHYEIEIESDVVLALRARARKSGVTLGHLANRLLRQRLRTSG